MVQVDSHRKILAWNFILMDER